MLESLRGNDIVCEDTGAVNEEADFGIFDSEDITFAFDTVFIVRKREDITSLDPLREYLGSIGDSLVIGEDDEAFKVHVHTNIPGDALSEAQKYGTLELAKIENMRLQHDDLTAGRKARSTTIWRPWKRSWKTSPRSRNLRRSLKSATAASPCARVRVWQACSAISASTRSLRAARR